MDNDPKADNEIELMRQELRRVSSLEKHRIKYVVQEGDEQRLMELYSRMNLTLENFYEQYAAHLLALLAGGGNSNYKGTVRFYRELYARSRQQNRSFADTSLKGLIESGDKLGAIFDQFFSDDQYEPPADADEIRLHLLALYAFFNHFAPKDPPALLILRLSYVATKVAWAIAAAMGVYSQRGTTKDRTAKGTTVKKSKKDKMGEKIIAEFRGINTRGMSKNEIAKRVRARLGKKMQSPPSVRTINRRLNEKGLI